MIMVLSSSSSLFPLFWWIQTTICKILGRLCTWKILFCSLGPVLPPLILWHSIFIFFLHFILKFTFLFLFVFRYQWFWLPTYSFLLLLSSFLYNNSSVYFSKEVQVSFSQCSFCSSRLSKFWAHSQWFWTTNPFLQIRGLECAWYMFVPMKKCNLVSVLLVDVFVSFNCKAGRTARVQLHKHMEMFSRLQDHKPRQVYMGD